MVIVSHPTGNTFSASVAHALYHDQLLAAFYTCVAWKPDHPLSALFPRSLRSILERRSRVQLPAELLHTRPFREVMRNALLRAGKKQWISDWKHPFSTDGVYRDLDKHIAGHLHRYPEARAVYAYEDGALHQFRRAKELGKLRLYDLPIGYWRANRRISEEEAELQPEWKGTLNALADSDEKCALKDEEIELADTIIVASKFVADTLDLFPGARKKIVVNPYGVPSEIAPARTMTDPNRPLRALYVGSLTQRKGISYLFEAVDKAGSAVSLTVIGRKVGQSRKLDSYCEKYRWIPSLPHAGILEEMQRHDVFVFPSLFEGFGLVVGEAISQGLPVITSPNPGGIEVVRDGVEGFVVPFRDADSITARLLQLNADRVLHLEMSDAARSRASELTWARYEQRMVALVREELKDHAGLKP